MSYASSKEIPVVVKGSGSGVWRHFISHDRYIVLDMKKMGKILEINLPDLYCRVESGVIDDDLNRALMPYGVFYPPGPISSWVATIGGEIANNASGVRSVKYGCIRDSILGMKVVSASGDLIASGFKTRMEVSDYQIDRLMVGSEGTLGIIVEAMLKLVPIPEYRGVGFAKFKKLGDACVATCHLLNSGVRPSSLGLMDKVAINAVYRTLNLGLPDEEAILIFEADGMVKEAVYYEIEKMVEICGKNRGFGIELSTDLNELNGIDVGNRKLLPELFGYKKRLRCSIFVDVVAVICSNMVECVRKIHEIAERNNVTMSVYGHCGSDCMHTTILMDPIEERQREDAEMAVAEVHEYVCSVYGTCSSEQDDKISRALSWEKEKADPCSLMKVIKKAFDPKNILNPYKFQGITENHAE